MFLNELLPERLVLVLAHFVWQGALLAAVSGAAAWLLHRAAASARYAVHLAVLLAMLACPAVTVWQISRAAAPAVVVHELPATAETNVAVTPAATSRLAAPVESTPVAWSGWLSLAYLLGVAVLSLRLVGSLLGVERLRRNSQAITDAGLLAALARQTKALNVRATPALAWSRDVAAPAMVGLLKPAILLPWAMADGLTVDQLELILAHELAHIRRLDAWVVLLQRLAETWLFFHPGVWWVSRQVSHERELCCDDLVLAAGAPAVQYADALVRTAEFSLGLSRPAAMVLSALGDETALGGRVRRLLCGAEARPRRAGLLAPLGVAAVLSLVITAAGSLALMAQQAGPQTSPVAEEPSVPGVAAQTTAALLADAARSTAQNPADAELELALEIDYGLKSRQRAVRLGSRVIVAFGEETEIGNGRIRAALTVNPAPQPADNQYVVEARVLEWTADGQVGTLSAPRVVARGGQEATISIGDEGPNGQRITLRVTVTPQRAPVRPAEADHVMKAIHWLWKIQTAQEPIPAFDPNCPAGVVAEKLPNLIKELRCTQCHAGPPERGVAPAATPATPAPVTPQPAMSGLPPTHDVPLSATAAERRPFDRRLYFDLTGRYPTAAELEAFQQRTQAEAIHWILSGKPPAASTEGKVVPPAAPVMKPLMAAPVPAVTAPTSVASPVRPVEPSAVISAPVAAAAAEEVKLLERLVASYQGAHDRLQQLHGRGMASTDELGKSEREMLEAMLRLSKARAAYESLRSAAAPWQPAPAQQTPAPPASSPR